MFKHLFTGYSEEIHFKKELITLFSIILYNIILIILIDLLKLNNYFIIRLILAMSLIFTFFLIILCFIRIIKISDNRDYLKRKNNEVRYKFKPKLYNIEDIKLWLEKYDIPDIIFVKSTDNKHYDIQITFDMKERRGPFINRKFMIDKQEYSDIDELIKLLYDYKIIDDNDTVCVEALIDKNNPELFANILKQIKDN